MNVGTLLSLSGVPGVEAGFTLLTATYSGIEAVKIYKQQCRDLSNRCRTLLSTLQDHSKDLDDERVSQIADEMDFMVQSINRKVMEWGSWGKLKSFLQQREIKDGIDKLHRDLDAAIMKFNIGVSLEMTHSNVESHLVKARDQNEIKELLQSIISNNEEMKALLNMKPASNSQHPRPVEEVMESLQTVLMQPELQPVEKQVFENGLWDLHRQTSKLPPLTDLTGQIELTSGLVASGPYNDVYQGHWLNREMRFIREVSVWRDLKHDNIVPLYGVVYIEDQLFAVSPWMDNNTSISYVVRYPQCDRLKVLNEAAEGLDYLHHKNIIHGDLRAENVLVSGNGISKLSNFGLSSFLEDCGTRALSAEDLKPGWTAPELIHGRGTLSSFSDIWSFGIVCLEVLLAGYTTQLDVAMRDLDKRKLPKRPKNVDLSDEMWKLMLRCWSQKPESRPTSKELKHSIVKLRRQPPAIGVFNRKPAVHRSSTASSDTSHTTVNTISSGSSIRNEQYLSEYGVEEFDPRPERLFHANDDTLRDFIDPIAMSYSNSPTSSSLQGWNGSHRGAGSPNRVSPHSEPDIHTHTFNSNFSSVPTTFRQPSTGGGAGNAGFISSSLPARLGSVSSDRPSYTPSVIPRQNSRQMTATSMGTHGHGGHASRPGIAERQNSRLVTSNSGYVLSGTLEGLVEQLITNFNLRRGAEYRDIFLATYLDFTTPLDLFQILYTLFYELEMTTSRHPDDRGAMQYNIFMVLQHWLTHYRRSITDGLLEKIRHFCVSAIRIKESITMIEPIAEELIQFVDKRFCPYQQLLYPKQPPRSPSLAVQPIPDANQITPKDLAIALTILEGDTFNRLEPCDYMAHLTRMEGHNNVKDVYQTNNKILFWVRSQVLHFEKVKNRADVMKFFVLTAAECLELRNFASLSAIVIALQSWPIEQLKRTRATMPLGIQSTLGELGDIINPTSNHRRYREALNGFTRAERARDRLHQPGCVPWLGIHLKELNATLQRNTRTLQLDSQRLVNFTRYVEFMERLNESLAYHRAPNLEKYRREGALAYLESKLKGVEVSDQEEEKQIARSKVLQAKERGFDEELARLGFM
ncbi:ras guanine nucleotide exchange factor domain-containing protein [Panaeolus papilionaceus]|nr:ras guanine nucleotide exchange factor domain-containing protein [Panaeolus papilionaceus]